MKEKEFKYKKINPKYEVTETFTFDLPKIYKFPNLNVPEINFRSHNNNLALFPGYQWNGATCAFDAGFIFESAEHDLYYELIRRKLLPPAWEAVADRIVKKRLAKRGWFSRLRSKWVHLGLSWFGVDPKKQTEKILKYKVVTCFQ